MSDITRRRFLGNSLLAGKAVCLGTAFPPEFLNAEKLNPGLKKVEAVEFRSPPKTSRDHERRTVA